MPRRGGPISKRPIPNVSKVVAVASGKGGVGKSTIALNLAFALALNGGRQRRLRVGLLDLDIFGPSIPTLMGLQHMGEPDLTEQGAIVPLTNHSLPCMSMGFLIPATVGQASEGEPESNIDTPIVWRGLMVQKAVQQLLFDVDWSRAPGGGGSGLDILVVDMPPGTGDVPLTLGQLVKVDGAVIVSTPQDVALSDVRKGIAMLRKVDVPITGLVLNQAHYLCNTCTHPKPKYIFGDPTNFYKVAERLKIPVLGQLPLVEGVSSSGDAGAPFMLRGNTNKNDRDDAPNPAAEEWKADMQRIADSVVETLQLSESH